MQSDHILRTHGFSSQFSVFFLLLLIFVPVQADVLVSGLVQDPANDVIEGQNPTYTFTVQNLDDVLDNPDTDINVTVLVDGVNGSDLFSSLLTNCTYNPNTGNFSCDPLPPAQTVDYQFQWNAAPAVGTYSLTFSVECSILGGEVPCAGGDVQTTTIVVTETAAVPGDFADLPGLTTSEREVAHALDEACAALTSTTEIVLPPTEVVAAKLPSENLLDICNALDAASIQDQVTAIQQITPKQAPAQGTSSVEISQRQFENITARMEALRSGATGVNVSDLSIDFQGVRLPIKLMSQAYTKQSGGSAGDEGGSLFGKFGFFLNGNLSVGDKDGSSNELGFDFNSKGVTAGLDYRFTDQFVVGGAIGYVGNESDFDASRGAMDVEGYTLALYSTYYQSESIYLDGIISYGWNDFDSSRQIGFLSFNEEASGNTDGTEFSISLGGGYDFNRNAFSYGPFARINYINVDIDSYTEHSSTGLELVYEEQEVESLTTLIGGQLSYAISTSVGVFSPQLRLEWAHEFKNDSRYINARFLYDPTATNFRLSTDNPDRNYFNLGVGVSATFAAGKSGYIYYEALLGQEDVERHSLAAGLRIEF